MEASTLRHASRRGLLARRSPLLRLQGDERLVALIRAGQDRAFEVLFDRYHARLLAFCRHMLGSAEDAEDVLQEVFANAHAAMLADTRHINVRPWLYRIARNRCLNHLRKPVPEGQDSMDVHPHARGTTTADRVQTREDFRSLVADVQDLPETQRTALLLREIDALSYEHIASAMDTTVPAVKSLLVRARMSLAEASQSRHLTCGDVRLELAEAAEGLRKASGPLRHHLRTCEPCREYRSELRASGRALASIAPAGLLVWLQALLGAKLFGFGSSSAAGGAAAATGASAATCGSGGAAGGALGGAAVAAGGAGAAAAAGGAAGGVSGALGAKAAAGVATAALLTAGAVEVTHLYSGQRDGAGTNPAAERAADPNPAAAPPAAPIQAADRDRAKKGEARPAGDARDARKAEVAGAEPGAEAAAAVAGAASEALTPAPAEETGDKPASGAVAGPAAEGSGSSASAGASGGGTAIILLPEEDGEEASGEGETAEDGEPSADQESGEERPAEDASAS